MSNTVIQIKRSPIGGNAAPTALQYGELGYSFASNTLYIGNSTTGVLQIGGEKYVQFLNGTAGTLTASKAVIVDANKIIDTFNVGNTTANVVITTGGVTVANSTQNTVINQTGASFGNSSVNTSVTVASVFQGNSTVFRTANSSTDVLVSSTTANVALSGTQLVAQANSTVNTTVTSAQVSVANNVGNTVISPATLLLQSNTTSNVVVTPTAIKLANSTANTLIPLATSAQYTSGNFYLNANGQWTTVSTGVATPAGSDTQIQYNDAGSSNGSAAFTFAKTGNTVTVANSLVVGTATVNSTLISVGTGTVNAGVVQASTSANVGANVSLSTARLFVGNSTVNAAFQSTNAVFANSTFTSTLDPKTLTITDVTISGNLTVNGTTTLINGTTVTYVDNMIKLASNNTTSNTIDIGVYGVYGNSTITYFTGLSRTASDGIWRLWQANTTEPSTTASTSNLATLAVGSLQLSSNLATTYGGTGLSALSATAVVTTNSTSGFSFLSQGTDGQVLQMQGTTLAFSSLDGGSF